MGAKISIKSTVDNFIESSKDTIMKNIDDRIKNDQPLKRAIDSVMPEFDRAYALDAKGLYFLQIIPISGGFVPFKTDAGRIETQVYVNGLAKILNDSIDFVKDPDKPQFKWATSEYPDFDMHASVKINEKDIESLLRQELVGKPFDVRDEKITINELYFDFKDQKIFSRAFISGYLDGEVSFSGRPNWDKDELEICDFEMDSELRGASRIVLWFAKKKMKSAFKKQMEEKMNEEIKYRISEINTFLRDFKLGDKFKINAEIYDYAIHPIKIGDKFLWAGINLSARGSAEIDALKFDVK